MRLLISLCLLCHTLCSAQSDPQKQVRRAAHTLDEADAAKVLAYIYHLNARDPAIKQAEDLPPTSVSWSSLEVDFDHEDQGAPVEHIFVVTNTGTSALRITNVAGACACIKTEWSMSYIQPGEHGYVSVVFATHDRLGPQRQPITVTMNTTPSQQVLALIGEVVLKLGNQ